MSVEAPTMSGSTIASTTASFAEGASSAASLSIASASEGLSQASVAGLGVESMAIGVESVGISTAVGEVGSNIAIQTEVAALEASDVAALAQTRDALDAIINGISVPQGVESAVSNAPIETENPTENGEELGPENTTEGEAGQNADSADNTTVQQDQEKREDADEVAQEDSENTTEDADSDSENDESEQDEETTEEDSTNKEETENESEEPLEEEKEDEQEKKQPPEEKHLQPIVSSKLGARIDLIQEIIVDEAVHTNGKISGANVGRRFASIASSDKSLVSGIVQSDQLTPQLSDQLSGENKDNTIDSIENLLAKQGVTDGQTLFQAAVESNQTYVPVDVGLPGSNAIASDRQVAQVVGEVIPLRRAA